MYYIDPRSSLYLITATPLPQALLDQAARTWHLFFPNTPIHCLADDTAIPLPALIVYFLTLPKKRTYPSCLYIGPKKPLQWRDPFISTKTTAIETNLTLFLNWLAPRAHPCVTEDLFEAEHIDSVFDLTLKEAIQADAMPESHA